ncbi:MAG: hypothetical protein AB7T06_04320 [Kofleriaceae bacterium]
MNERPPIPIRHDNVLTPVMTSIDRPQCFVELATHFSPSNAAKETDARLLSAAMRSAKRARP